MDVQITNYIVEVGIGTFKVWFSSSSSYNLSSSIVILASRNYRALRCNSHRLCNNGESINTCLYLQKHANHAVSEGYLASETFTFRSSNNRVESIKDLVFGCGFDNVGFKSFDAGNKNRIAGIMGMGWEARSFINQLKYRSQGRFSYCLPPDLELFSGWAQTFRVGELYARRRCCRSWHLGGSSITTCHLWASALLENNSRSLRTPSPRKRTAMAGA
ncbi:hypothetical protein U1Q18_019243 [Sarracenia purpurea var. burkii]